MATTGQDLALIEVNDCLLPNRVPLARCWLHHILVWWHDNCVLFIIRASLARNIHYHCRLPFLRAQRGFSNERHVWGKSGYDRVVRWRETLLLLLLDSVKWWCHITKVVPQNIHAVLHKKVLLVLLGLRWVPRVLEPFLRGFLLLNTGLHRGGQLIAHLKGCDQVPVLLRVFFRLPFLANALHEQVGSVWSLQLLVAFADQALIHVLSQLNSVLVLLGASDTLPVDH